MGLSRNEIAGKVTNVLKDLLHQSDSARFVPAESSTVKGPETSNSLSTVDQVEFQDSAQISIDKIVDLVVQFVSKNTEATDLNTSKPSGHAKTEYFSSWNETSNLPIMATENPGAKNSNGNRSVEVSLLRDTNTRYSILSPLAEGGLGKVSVAFDENLSRQVALKEIKTLHLRTDAVRSRFLFEALVTGALQHPSVVPIYSVGTQPDGSPFYAMKLIQGESLRRSVEKRYESRSLQSNAEWRASERRLLQRFMSSCNAIAYAHDKSIIHRDIKPDNIMLGDFGETIVVDWGLAKWIRPATKGESKEEQGELDSLPQEGQQYTQHGSAVGTPAYMAPEQAAGELSRIGRASDVYALGATLAYVLTGKSIVAADSVEQMLSDVRAGRTALCGPSPSNVSPALWAICRKACSVEAEDRYPTVNDLTDDLERYMADDQVSVYRERAIERATRWGRRNPAKLVGTSVSILFVAFLSLAGFLQERRFNRDLSAARTRETVAFAKYVGATQEFQGFVQDHISEILANPEFMGPEYAKIRETLLSSAIRVLGPMIDDTIPVFEEKSALARNLYLSAKLKYELGRFAESNRDAEAYMDKFGKKGLVEQRTETELMELNSLRFLQGNIRQNLQDYAGAEAAFLECLRFEKKLTENDSNYILQMQLANCYGTLALLYRDQTRNDESESYYALAIETLNAMDPPLNQLEWFEQFNASQLLHNAAVFAEEQGDLQRANLLHRQALDIRANIYGRFPRLPIAAASYAESLRNLASLTETLESTDAANQQLQLALEINANLAARYPQVPDYQFSTTVCENSLAYLLLDSGDNTHAEEHFKNVVRICNNCEADFPEFWKFATTKAKALDGLTSLAVDPKDSISYSTDALEEWQSLMTRYPKDMSFQVRAAGSRTNLGTYLRLTGHTADAIPLLRASLDQLRVVESKNKDVDSLFEFLQITNHSLAIGLYELGEFAESADCYEESARYATSEKQRDTLLNWAKVCKEKAESDLPTQ